MGQEGLTTQVRRFSVESKREAVAMLEMSGVSTSQIAGELGLGGLCWGAGGASCARSRPRRFSATGGHGMTRGVSCVVSWPESPRSEIFYAKRQRAS
jgi:hypothetical protein